MGLEEEIQQGNLRLHKVEEDKVQLRKKSGIVNAEVKKLEDEIKKYFLNKKTRMVRQEARDQNDGVKAYCHKLISLMPWLGPHITNHSDQGSALQMVKCAISIVTIQGGDFPGTMTKYMRELYTGGVTT